MASPAGADVGGGTERPLRVVIAGGGTGGHLYPGIAVARELQARRPDVQVSFAGTTQGIESRVVPREGFALDVIRIGGLKGKSFVALARGALLVPLGFAGGWRIVSHRRPDLVIGVGGYSSGPVVLAAALRGVPTMLLEQNAVPGLTNRLLARVVRAAAVTYETTEAYFGSRAFVSGNPVRPEFFAEGSAREPDHHGEVPVTRVLVFGGSQGAHAINVAMVESAARLAACPELHLVHQTGERDLDAVRAAYREAGLSAVVEPYLDDMGRQLGRADVVVCRAGATTLAEIAAVGRAAILMPLPTATDDHQRKNAESMAAAGAAEVLLQTDAGGGALASRILALANDAARRRRMAAAARALGRPEAAKVIVDRAMALVNR